jgi:hypothetical protein
MAADAVNCFARLHVLSHAFPELPAAPHRALQRFVAITERRSPPRIHKVAAGEPSEAGGGSAGFAGGGECVARRDLA